MKMEENREMLMELEEENFNNSRMSKGSKNHQEASGQVSQIQDKSSEKVQNIER